MKKWPRLFPVHVHQADVGFVDQGRGFERLPWLLLSELLGRQLAQLVVDQRQELFGRLRVALLDVQEDAGHVRHRQTRDLAASAWSPERRPSDGAR